MKERSLMPMSHWHKKSKCLPALGRRARCVQQTKPRYYPGGYLLQVHDLAFKFYLSVGPICYRLSLGTKHRDLEMKLSISACRLILQRIGVRPGSVFELITTHAEVVVSWPCPSFSSTRSNKGFELRG